MWFESLAGIEIRNEIEVKSPKTRGRQLSIKDISSVTAEPTRGWDDKATTTKILFA